MSITISSVRFLGNDLVPGSCCGSWKLLPRNIRWKYQQLDFRAVKMSLEDWKCVHWNKCDIWVDRKFESAVFIVRWLECSGGKPLWRWSRWSGLCADCWRPPAWKLSPHRRPSGGPSLEEDSRWYGHHLFSLSGNITNPCWMHWSFVWVNNVS